jgi:DNA-binding MarR family transcriptional regulator
MGQERDHRSTSLSIRILGNILAIVKNVNPVFGEAPATQLFRLVITLATHLRTRMDQRLASIGLTTQQAAVLTYLEGEESPATLGSVARALGTTHQNARQIIDALRRKGLVEVEVDPDDRRARRIIATPLVAELFVDRNLDDHLQVGEWLSALTVEEQAVAVGLLHRVLSTLVQPS